VEDDVDVKSSASGLQASCSLVPAPDLLLLGALESCRLQGIIVSLQRMPMACRESVEVHVRYIGIFRIILIP
jgi:hypothetical protein